MQTNHDGILLPNTTSDTPPSDDRILLDHDQDYRPIVILSQREAGPRIVGQASYSLADNTCSGELLSSLAQFVQDWHGHLVEHNLPHSVKHRLAAQFVYLAYWKAITTELCIERANGTIYISVRFPQHPALSSTLAQLIDPVVDVQSASALENWLRFAFETVAEHAAIWQIGLVVERAVYEQFAPADLPKAAFIFTSNPVQE